MVCHIHCITVGCYTWFDTVLIWLFSRTCPHSLYCCEQMEQTIFQGCNESFSDKFLMESKDNVNTCSNTFQVLLSTQTPVVGGPQQIPQGEQHPCCKAPQGSMDLHNKLQTANASNTCKPFENELLSLGKKIPPHTEQYLKCC